MKDRERISNLEEMIAEVLMRLDGVAEGQKTLRADFLELATNQIKLNDRQATLEESMIDLIKVVRKNTIDLEQIKATMVTKDMLNNLFEAMMKRFDASDRRFDKMDERMDKMDARFDKMDARMDVMQGDISHVKGDVTILKSR